MIVPASGAHGSAAIPSIDDIRDCLDRVNEALVGQGCDYGVWTSRIKTELVELGRRHEFYVCTSGVGRANHGEWLYDVCWLHYASWPDRLIAAMPLALECEWGMDRDHAWILEDFQKLCFAGAWIKWMVFQSTDDEAFKGIGDRLARQAMLVRGATESRYCMSCWIASRSRFVHAELDAVTGRWRMFDDARPAP